MRTIRAAAVVLLAMIMSGAVVVSASAGVKRILPHQLRPFSFSRSVAANEAAAKHDFLRVGSATGAGSASFAAPVKLKPGSRITRFSVQAYCSNPAVSVFHLYRIKDGEIETLASIDKTGEAYAKSWLHDDTITFPLVRKGYTYWVGVLLEGQYPQVFGLKVFYR